MRLRPVALFLVLLLAISAPGVPSRADVPMPLLYTITNLVSVDNFGWVYVDTTVAITNNGTVDSGPFLMNMTFMDVFPPHTYELKTNGTLSSIETDVNSTTYWFDVANVPAGDTVAVNLWVKLWGMISEYTPGSYTYNFTSFPIVLFPGGLVTNATSQLQFVPDVTPSTDLPSFGFVRQAKAYPTFLKQYVNETQLFAEFLRVNFSSASTASFVLYRIQSVDRELFLNDDGRVMVADHIIIRNEDTQDITVLNLTVPTGGDFYLKQGLVDGGAISLQFGQVSLPFPVSASSLGDILLTYPMPPSAVAESGGALVLNVSGSVLSFVNLVDRYSLNYSFPEGTEVHASGPLTYSNVTSIPTIMITAKVPWGWSLGSATPVGLGALLAVSSVYLLYRRSDVQPYEEEGREILDSKSKVVLDLLELYRLRGEGYSSLDMYSTERKGLEEEKNKITSRLNDFRVKAQKDKVQKAFYEKLAAEDLRLEQAHREGKHLMEERLAGRLAEKEFTAKIMALERSIVEKAKERPQPTRPTK